MMIMKRWQWIWKVFLKLLKHIFHEKWHTLVQIWIFHFFGTGILRIRATGTFDVLHRSCMSQRNDSKVNTICVSAKQGRFSRKEHTGVEILWNMSDARIKYVWNSTEKSFPNLHCNDCFLFSLASKRPFEPHVTQIFPWKDRPRKLIIMKQKIK